MVQGAILFAPHPQEMPFLNATKGRPRATTGNFISGDNYRALCDHILDEDSPSLNPARVNAGDTIFVSSFYLEDFFNEYHPRIANRYILVTVAGDRSIPSGYTVNQPHFHTDCGVRRYLEDERLFLWFAQNVDATHPKIVPVPIGLESCRWGRNYVTPIIELCNAHEAAHKRYLLSANFTLQTNRPGRKPLHDMFRNKSFCYWPENKKVKAYLLDVAHSKFILSPHGNGLDCHRTWEALYVGTFPIVKTSTLDPLYEDLPVLIVQNWEDITEEFLHEKFAEMSNRQYRLEKLRFDYWANLIVSAQKLCRLNN